jgi:hypothetical protein
MATIKDGWELPTLPICLGCCVLETVLSVEYDGESYWSMYFECDLCGTYTDVPDMYWPFEEENGSDEIDHSDWLGLDINGTIRFD